MNDDDQYLMSKEQLEDGIWQLAELGFDEASVREIVESAISELHEAGTWEER